MAVCILAPAITNACGSHTAGRASTESVDKPGAGADAHEQGVCEHAGRDRPFSEARTAQTRAGRGAVTHLPSVVASPAFSLSGGSDSANGVGSPLDRGVAASAKNGVGSNPISNLPVAQLSVTAPSPAADGTACSDAARMRVSGFNRREEQSTNYPGWRCPLTKTAVTDLTLVAGAPAISCSTLCHGTCVCLARRDRAESRIRLNGRRLQPPRGRPITQLTKSIDSPTVRDPGNGDRARMVEAGAYCRDRDSQRHRDRGSSRHTFCAGCYRCSSIARSCHEPRSADCRDGQVRGRPGERSPGDRGPRR